MSDLFKCHVDYFQCHFNLTYLNAILIWLIQMTCCDHALSNFYIQSHIQCCNWFLFPDAPSVTVFTINDNKTVAIVSEKSPVTLDCRVSSKPPSTIQLFNGSTLLSEQQKTLQASCQILSLKTKIYYGTL